MHAASAAADVAVAVALAGSLFFSIDPGQARWRVGLYLLLTLAPFAIVAPLIGPLIDRARGGSRWVIVATGAGRVVVCYLMMRHLDGLLLFPEAFLMLVLAKSYSVAKTAYVPATVRDDAELVSANAKLALLAALAGPVAAIPAGLLHVLVGSRGVVALGAALFVVTTALAFRLDKAADWSLAHKAVVAARAGGGPADERRGAGRTADGIAFGVAAPADATAGARRRPSSGAGGQPRPVAGRLGHGPAPRGGRLPGLPAGVRTALQRRLRGRLRPRAGGRRRRQPVRRGPGPAPASLAARGRRCWEPRWWPPRWWRRSPRCSAAAWVPSWSWPASPWRALRQAGLRRAAQRDAPTAEKGRLLAQFEARFQMLWVIGAFIPVVLPIPARLGYGLMAALLGAAAACVVGGRRSLGSMVSQLAWGPSGRPPPGRRRTAPRAAAPTTSRTRSGAGDRDRSPERSGVAVPPPPS